jgi:alkylation response protein AidB-like acyl-CoA dehydrogenase
MAGSDVIINLLEEVDRIRPIIKEHASSAEANRQLSSAVYDAMYDAGLFAMFAPTAYGGLELHPVDALRVWEAVLALGHRSSPPGLSQKGYLR